MTWREGNGGGDVQITQKPLTARLLFLSANANDRSLLAVDREYNRVKSSLQALGVWPEWRLALEHVPAATWEQVPEQLLLHAASIVHFAGHGHADGSLEFGTHQGGQQRIQAEGLAELFESYAGQIRLVVLNACYSDVLAEALTAHIDAVVGMTHAISDHAAALFAPIFYQQLAGGKSVQTAFEVGRAMLIGQHRYPDATSSSMRDVALLGAADHDALPRLRVRTGVDASRMRFVPAMAPAPYRKPKGDSITKPAEVIASSGSGHLSLNFVIGKYQGAEVPLPASGVIRIGRTSGLEVVLVEDMMSRVHAQIQISHGVVAISDHGSTNGTFVNGERIERATRLDLGDRIMIGTSIIKIAAATGTGLNLEEARKHVETLANTRGSAMSGVLDEIPIEDILRLLSTAKKSGILEIQTESNFGRVSIAEGEILGAVVESNLNMSGRGAFLEICTWRTGVFALVPVAMASFVASPIPGAINGATEQLLMEGLKVVRRSRAIR